MKRVRPLVAFLLLGVLALIWGCGAGSTPSTPQNSFSQVVTFDAPEAGSVQIVSTSAVDTLTTPWFPVAGGTGSVTVLGLLAQTSYVHTIAFASSVSGTTSTLGTFTATTPALPDDLLAFAMTVTSGTTSPEPGYFLVSGTGTYQFAFDPAGNIRWYKLLDPSTVECKMQYDGSFTAYVGTSEGFEPGAQGSYKRFHGDGTEFARYQMSVDSTESGLPTPYLDPHELQITQDAAGEHLHWAGYEFRPQTPGGPLAAWHEIIREQTTGVVEFRWKSWDYFSFADTTEGVSGGGADVDHLNSLEIASDGNYVASFRDTDAVLKIDFNSGAVLWQLGGIRNQFSYVNDSFGGTSGQHSARPLPNGDILIYDDGIHHTPPESRAVEYALDTAAMTATVVWEYRHSPPVFTGYLGSVERLQNGNTLVAFSLLGVVDEVSPTGQLVWETTITKGGQPAAAYRVRRLPSLYFFQQP
jgi:hypothetical protein